MKKLDKIAASIAMLTFVSALICVSEAQTPVENMKTFFNSEIPGIRIRVNATSETQPTENVTVVLRLEALAPLVDVVEFNLSIFGFIGGKDRILMANITDNDFSLDNTLIREYNCTFNVPQIVWDVTYGEISLTYSAEIGNLYLGIPRLTFGFTMTHIENVYLEDVKQLLENYEQLNQTFSDCFQMNFSREGLTGLNQSYWELQ